MDEGIEVRHARSCASRLGRHCHCNLRHRIVRGMLADWHASGLTRATLVTALKPLQVIYRRAIEDGDFAVNPCERQRFPAARGRRERIASPSEAAALIAALRPKDRALWG